MKDSPLNMDNMTTGRMSASGTTLTEARIKNIRERSEKLKNILDEVEGCIQAGKAIPPICVSGYAAIADAMTMDLRCLTGVFDTRVQDRDNALLQGTINEFIQERVDNPEEHDLTCVQLGVLKESEDDWVDVELTIVEHVSCRESKAAKARLPSELMEDQHLQQELRDLVESECDDQLEQVAESDCWDCHETEITFE